MNQLTAPSTCPAEVTYGVIGRYLSVANLAADCSVALVEYGNDADVTYDNWPTVLEYSGTLSATSDTLSKVQKNFGDGTKRFARSGAEAVLDGAEVHHANGIVVVSAVLRPGTLDYGRLNNEYSLVRTALDSARRLRIQNRVPGIPLLAIPERQLKHEPFRVLLDKLGGIVADAQIQLSPMDAVSRPSDWQLDKAR
jgi:hypothetical protein